MSTLSCESEDPTLIEEYPIARSHPIGTMVKTSGIRNPAMAFVGTLSQYRRIQATRFNFTITSELYGQARQNQQ
jgi:hypothetical protein